MKSYWPIIVTVAAWSVGPVLIRGGLDRGFSPLTSTLVGGALSVPIFLVMLRWSGAIQWPRLAPVAFWQMVLAGFLGIGGTMFSYLAIGMAPIAVAVSISNTHPLFTALFSRFMGQQETLTRASWAGIGLILLGLTLVSIGGTNH